MTTFQTELAKAKTTVADLLAEGGEVVDIFDDEDGFEVVVEFEGQTMFVVARKEGN